MCNRDVPYTPHERFPAPVSPFSAPRPLLGTPPFLDKGPPEVGTVGRRTGCHPSATRDPTRVSTPPATDRIMAQSFQAQAHCAVRGTPTQDWPMQVQHHRHALTALSIARLARAFSMAPWGLGENPAGHEAACAGAARAVTRRLPHAIPTPVCARAPWSTVKHPPGKTLGPPRRACTTLALPPPRG
jgi:hypothetical protein